MVIRPDKAPIGIAHPQLGFGGSEAAVLWGIEALKRDFDVTLITGGVANLDRLNAYYEGQRTKPCP